jgi:CBS domain containing-hemolysin-like protein
MVILLTYLFGALCISFLCSVLEAVLMSTPLSFITAKEEEGVKSATLFKKLKLDPERPLEAILTFNTIAHTVGAAGVGQKGSELFVANGWSYFGNHDIAYSCSLRNYP